MQNYKSTILNKVTKILIESGIDSIGTDSPVITRNLIASFIINFSKLLNENENTRKIIQDYVNADDSDPFKLFQFLESKGVNYELEVRQAEKETLNMFLDELKNDLSVEKIQELRKIVEE